MYDLIIENARLIDGIRMAADVPWVTLGVSLTRLHQCLHTCCREFFRWHAKQTRIKRDNEKAIVLAPWVC